MCGRQKKLAALGTTGGDGGSSAEKTGVSVVAESGTRQARGLRDRGLRRSGRAVVSKGVKMDGTGANATRSAGGGTRGRPGSAMAGRLKTRDAKATRDACRRSDNESRQRLASGKRDDEVAAVAAAAAAAAIEAEAEGARYGQHRRRRAEQARGQGRPPPATTRTSSAPGERRRRRRRRPEWMV